MTTATLPAPPTAGPAPVRWTAAEFRRMTDLGFFAGRRVELADGRLLETAPGTPVPRPLRWTRAEYYRLGDHDFFPDRRVELIRGEVLLMSPMGEPHVRGIVLTLEALRLAFGPGHTFRPQAPLDLSGTEDPLPDVAVVAGDPRDHTATPTSALLVVEVAESSLFFDTTTKAEDYAAAGIADYWVLGLTGDRLLVFRDPRPIPAGGHTYHTRLTLGPADTVSPLAVPEAVIRVADLLP